MEEHRPPKPEDGSSTLLLCHPDESAAQPTAREGVHRQPGAERRLAVAGLEGEPHARGIPDQPNPIRVRARIVWEGDGEEWIDATARRWTDLSDGTFPATLQFEMKRAITGMSPTRAPTAYVGGDRGYIIPHRSRTARPHEAP